MIGIYKIQNKINGKIYIGQSIHIKRRWAEHCMPSKTSHIAKAIQQYGKQNFDFSVIEECPTEELNSKEQYWIHFYNSLVPNGYNVAEDTSDTIHTTYVYYDKDTLNNIIKDLQNTTLSLKEISTKYNINISSISRINNGITHHQNNLSYPIRKTNWHNRIPNFCIDCGVPISNTAIRCNACNAKLRITKVPISRDELKNLIRQYPFTKIANQFNVSDNTIRKWCKKYNLPYKKREISSYSEKEWDKI